MRYIISKSEILKDKVRLFPFGAFFRNGRWHKFTPKDAEEMVSNFEAGIPKSVIPINVEHQIHLGKIGQYKKLWVDKDGIYAQIEWTDIGKRLILEDKFSHFSPEISWKWQDPKTGKIYSNVLVGGAVTNYPFHGDDTILFSDSGLNLLQKLAVLEITPRSVKNVTDKELLSLHHRMHQLAANLRLKKDSPTPQMVHVPGSMDEDEEQEISKISIEDVVNAHIMIVQEMHRRGMKHGIEGDWLDSQETRFLKSSSFVQQLLESEEDEILLIPGFVSIVGSAIHSRDPNDLDVLIRAEKNGKYFNLGEQTLWLPLRNYLNPYKEDKPLRFIASAQGPHADAIVLGDLVLKVKPHFQPIEKSSIEKKAKNFIYFTGTGALDSPRRDASLMVVSERHAVLFDGGKDIQAKNLPKVPDLILLTDPTENKAAAEKLANSLGVKVTFGDWSGQDIEITSFKVKHTKHDVYGYRIKLSDITIVYAPEFFKYPKEAKNADIGIFDGSAFEKPILFKGGGHAPLVDTLVEAYRNNIGRIIFTHIGKPVEEKLGLLQYVGVEIAMDGQAIILKAGLTPGRQNFRPPKTGRGYGQNEFADVHVAWEVWGRENVPFAVEPKFDGWRIIVHKRNDEISVFSEDANRNIADKVNAVVESIENLEGDLILDGELELYALEAMKTNNFDYKAGDKIERIDMPSFLSAKEPLGKYKAVFNVFDIIYKDGDIHRLPWVERRRILSNTIKETENLKLSPSWIVEDKMQYLTALRKAYRTPFSEGAMMKAIRSPYVLEGETTLWAKVKAMKELRVSVVSKKRAGKGAWIYTTALSDGSIIGNTYATGIQAEIGDVLEIRVAEIKIRREGEKRVITWDNPIVHSKKSRDTALTTPEEAEKMAKLHRTGEVDFSLDELLDHENLFDAEIFGKILAIQ